MLALQPSSAQPAPSQSASPSELGVGCAAESAQQEAAQRLHVVRRASRTNVAQSERVHGIRDGEPDEIVNRREIEVEGTAAFRPRLVLRKLEARSANAVEQQVNLVESRLGERRSPGPVGKLNRHGLELRFRNGLAEAQRKPRPREHWSACKELDFRRLDVRRHTPRADNVALIHVARQHEHDVPAHGAKRTVETSVTPPTEHDAGPRFAPRFAQCSRAQGDAVDTVKRDVPKDEACSPRGSTSHPSGH